MLSEIKNVVKYNRIIYNIYYIFGSLFLKFLGLFIKADDNLILYVVYGGQRYDDSPRFVYEYMSNVEKTEKKYTNYKHVWAFINPDEIAAPRVSVDQRVKIDTLRYFFTAMRAKYWVTNSSVSRGLNFKKKQTINILFQHGTAGIKKLDADLAEGNKSFSLGFDEKFDYIIIQGKKEEPILKRAWRLNGENLYNVGLPRNDELVFSDEDKITTIRKTLGIPLNKKVILYAPTFREYSKDSGLSTYLDIPFNFSKWEKQFGDRYVFLMTAHYEIAKLVNLPKNSNFVINAFKYPYINDLMLVSDILISDYSSIIFDYSILGRPIIAYAYDYDRYIKERGIYSGYESLFSDGVIKKEEELIRVISAMDEKKYADECEFTVNCIRDKYISHFGNATEKSVSIIFGGE